jgi:hypothetical protein
VMIRATGSAEPSDTGGGEAPRVDNREAECECGERRRSGGVTRANTPSGQW